MATLAKHLVMCHSHQPTSSPSSHKDRISPTSTSTSTSAATNKDMPPPPLLRRRSLITTLLAASASVTLMATPPTALAYSWGTKSFLKERFFEPALSPEEAAERIKNTAEGLKSIREMLDTMSWRYCIFYIRLKSSYLSSDLKNAFSTVPASRRSTYVKTANELVDNIAELDHYVRTPKVYESYLYYEKTLKSLDDIVALLA
ncbi:photosynthetic NDH subunit of lumenal location 2, chloroplastic [Aristolochia californica]|uniref:photosynthetic NDH subunit of lumenal location 2, chloroplastic n=1 Tax=Aristolochia californica TaxID=171875 RepID=UPI0035E36339